jgi:hypothetical protein
MKVDTLRIAALVNFTARSKGAVSIAREKEWIGFLYRSFRSPFAVRKGSFPISRQNPTE